MPKKKRIGVEPAPCTPPIGQSDPDRILRNVEIDAFSSRSPRSHRPLTPSTREPTIYSTPPSLTDIFDDGKEKKRTRALRAAPRGKILRETGLFVAIEVDTGIDRLPVDPYFEVEMWRRRLAGRTRQGDDLIS